jgi:hypothetical protein
MMIATARTVIDIESNKRDTTSLLNDPKAMKIPVSHDCHLLC